MSSSVSLCILATTTLAVGLFSGCGSASSEAANGVESRVTPAPRPDPPRPPDPKPAPRPGPIDTGDPQAAAAPKAP